MTTDYTLGVEEEFQLVDARTGELRSRARAVLAADWTGDLKPEMQQNTVEVETRVCGSAAEIEAELKRLRFQTAVAAESDGLRVVAAGTHPFSLWTEQRFTHRPEYQQIRSQYRRLAETQHIFGTHIHVALPGGVDRARVMNTVRHLLPYLLALTASSPRLFGEETGYASYRWILWRRWPRSGPPPRFRDEAEFRALRGTMVETGLIDAPGRLYWDLRPHHAYPTIEFRIADATPRLEDVTAVAALARAAVAAAAEGAWAEPDAADALVHPLLVENIWRAARDGVQAELVCWQDGGWGAVRLPAALDRLLERLGPVAERLGDAAELERLRALVARGGAAARIRERAEERGAEAELVHWLAGETVLGTGVDRRERQRNG